MPFKTIKKDAADALTLEWVLHIKDYKLIVDRKRCVGCQVCTIACPKEAIKTVKQPPVDHRAAKSKVDIDIAKCNFCGVCDATCPYGAIKITLNGQHDLTLLAKESYPQLVKEISINTKACPKECDNCVSTCPLALIKVSKVGFDSKPVSDINALTPNEKKRVQITLDIDKEHCPTCRVCEFKCTPGAIKVKKAIQGSIEINQEKCPPECHSCVDVCPIVGALTVGDGNKVTANELYCTFCGACKNVCPVDEALSVRRTTVSHTPVHSGTWNKALERLTSTNDAAKELKATAAHSRREAVEKRFESEELKEMNFR
jgi:4Fe-4S ferredoxin